MMLDSEGSMNEITTDLLIIGGGLAAASAAIEAIKYGIKVTLVDKGRFGASGSSPISGGAVAPFIPPELGGDPRDTKDALFRDIVETGLYLNEQKMVEIYVEESTENFLLLDKIVPFMKKADGKFAPYAWGTDAGPKYGKEARRNIQPVGISKGGLIMMQGLRKEALHRGVQVLENIMITRLLSQNGIVAGAFGVNNPPASWGAS